MASNGRAEKPPTADEGNNGLTSQHIGPDCEFWESKCYQSQRSITSETAYPEFAG